MCPSGWGAPTVRTGIAFAAIFIGTLILASLLQWLLAQLIASTGLSSTDRFLGLVFGGARGLLVCIVMLMVVREFASETVWWRDSVLQAELLAFEGDFRELVDRGRGLIKQVPLPDNVLPEDITPG